MYKSNNKIIISNVISAFIYKGGGLLVTFFSVPAFVSYFNNNIYLGIWYTLLSVLMWFLTFDMGIGNGLRNTLVKALANNNRLQAKQIISSGFFSISIITLILSFLVVGLIGGIDLYQMFNVNATAIPYETLQRSAIYITIALMLRFFLTTISSIFYALQKSSINNLLALCVNIIQLAFVLHFKYKDPNEALLKLSFSYILISNIPIIIAAIIIFSTDLKDCKPSIKFISKKAIKGVLTIGGVFFICQILYMLIVNTNEFLITQFYGAQYTVEYTFYYKLTSIVSMVIMLIMTPIWSVVTKAQAEKNFIWLVSLYKKIKIVGLLVFCLEFALIPCLQFIMNLWLGENSIKVNYVTAIAFAVFGGWFAYSSMLSTIVCGLARMKLQISFYGIGVVLKFIGIIYISQLWDNWVLVIWLNAIILCIYSIAQHISLNKFFSNKIIKSI